MGMAITNRLRGIGQAWSGRALLAGLSVVLWLGSTGVPTVAWAQAPAVQSGLGGLVDSGDLPIRVGDVISIQVFATPELSGSVRVDQTGAVTFPVGGKLQVSGMTSTEAAVAIENFLKVSQIMLDPHVTVLVSQYASQGITITGEVRAPGSFPLVGPHSVADALAVAGELTPGAGDTISVVHRSDPSHPVIIPINSPDFDEITRNTPIYPRDIMTVSKASVIYLIGDIGRPGPLPVVRGEPPTILNVLSQAGGVTTTSRLSKALIIRKTPSGTTTIPLDLGLIMKNRAPNILLQSADVLIVPHSTLKAILIPIPQQVASGLVGIGTAALYVR